jgi:flagellar biosynthesis component FlhA
MTFKTNLAAIFGAAALAFAAPVMAQDEQSAQDEQTAQDGQPMEMAAEDVTDEQVNAFVDAILAVEEVRAEYGSSIEAAEDEAEQQELVQEANEAAFAAVDEVENMDVDTYVAIANAAGENEELNQRVVARLSEVREE